MWIWHVRHTLALICAKNHLLIFSSFLDIWENVEWPRFFGPPCIYRRKLRVLGERFPCWKYLYSFAHRPIHCVPKTVPMLKLTKKYSAWTLVCGHILFMRIFAGSFKKETSNNCRWYSSRLACMQSLPYPIGLIKILYMTYNNTEKYKFPLVALWWDESTKLTPCSLSGCWASINRKIVQIGNNNIFYITMALLWGRWKWRTWKWRTIEMSRHEIDGHEIDGPNVQAWNWRTWKCRTFFRCLNRPTWNRLRFSSAPL